MAKLIVNPTAANRREILLARSLISIGRDPSNDLVLPDAMVSRRHAVIECRGSQYFLRDCNSSNGSVVNGDRVSERSLRDGDLVAIGSARLLFREEREEAGAKIVPHPSAPRLACPACRIEYRKGDLFCRECGEKLPEPSGPPKAVCPSCGTAVLLPARFCNACGARLPQDEAASLKQELAPGSGGPESLPSEAARHEAGSTSTSGALAVSPRPASRPEAALPLALPAARPSIVRRDAPVAHSTPERPNVAKAPEPGTGPGAKAAPAPSGARAVAAFIDLGLVLLPAALLVTLVGSYSWSRGPGPEAGLPAVLPVALAVAAAAAWGVVYLVYFWGVRGASPGKKMLELAVEGEDGRFPIGVARAGARVFGYLLSGLSLGVGFLMVPLTGRGLHDLIAGTRVVTRRGKG